MDSKNTNMDVVLITKGESLIDAYIFLRCPNCGYSRRFRNQFTADNMELIIVTLKIVDWLSCEKCGDLLHSEFEFHI
ncbi:MAG: hypothetical protein GY870_17100 [archaeon]|nr:hypothetical protein [archaeon]